MNILHIYGQPFWHAPVVIAGDREALLQLQAAVTAALDTGSGVASAFVADGEGYFVCVRQLDGTAMADLKTPYTDTDMTDNRGIFPDLDECKRMIREIQDSWEKKEKSK